MHAFVTLYQNFLLWFVAFFKNRCKAIVDHFGQRINANYFIVEDSYLSESTCTNVCYRYVVKQKNTISVNDYVQSILQVKLRNLLPTPLFLQYSSVLCKVSLLLTGGYSVYFLWVRFSSLDIEIIFPFPYEKSNSSECVRNFIFAEMYLEGEDASCCPCFKFVNSALD